MGKKSSRPPASKVSSAASPAVSGLTYTGNKSSVLRASFAPFEFQLALFASVIQGLGAQQLRIHDTNTGRLVCEHELGPREIVTSLDWGYYSVGGGKQKEKQSKRKRKRHSDVNGFDQGDVVVAFGTNTSDIRMYSPTEDKIVGTLSGAHENDVKDFKFTAQRPGEEGWSIGGDNRLVQWDLRTGQSLRTINLPATSTFTTLSRPLPSNPPVICASQTPYIIDVDETGESPLSFPAMRNPIHTIISSSTNSAMEGVFLVSDNERYINAFDPQTQKLVMNLVVEKEVSALSLYSGLTKPRGGQTLPLEKQVLAVVTDDGTVELFTKPFSYSKDSQASKTVSLKARGRQMTRRADASVKLLRSENSEALVPVVTAAFEGPELVVAWADGGVIPVFERIKWLDDSTEELSFTGTKNVVRTKSGSALGSVTVNGTKSAEESHVNESRAVVEQGNLAEEDIEMQDSRQAAASLADSEDDSDEDREADKPNEKVGGSRKQEDADSDVEMENAADEKEEDGDETGEPSFGELLRAHVSEEIDVEAELEDEVRIGPLAPGKSNTAVHQIPSGVSLATVLTQSLKTNDNAMLESCFHTGDLSIIRTTIQRLDSSLAVTLLQKLAERLSSRPGRYGHLLIWVQWTCVAHGGALAGKPDLLKRMTTLFKVMDQRSSSLPSLLLLKGKLDMLDAQLGLRQSIRSGAEGADSEDEEHVIYVEGEDDEEDAEDEDSEADANPNRKTSVTPITPRTKTIRNQATDEDELMMNGIGDDSDNDEDEEEEDDDEAEGSEDENDVTLLDTEAEESVGSSDAEESLEENEDDEDDEDEDSAGSMVDFIADTEDGSQSEDEERSAPPSKKVKVHGTRGKSRR